MTRPTDSAIMEQQRQINGQLVDLCHAMLELLQKLAGDQDDPVVSAALVDFAFQITAAVEQGKSAFDAVAKNAEQAAEAILSEEQPVALMRDPRYWKKRDPEILAKVTEGFRRLYPEN